MYFFFSPYLPSNPSIPQNVTNPSSVSPVPTNVTRDDRKRAAQERRRRLMEQMASKQKAFASTHLKDMESLNQQTVDRQDQLDKSEPSYECVICQTPGRPEDDMVLLDMMCESNRKFFFFLSCQAPAGIVGLPIHTLSTNSGFSSSVAPSQAKRSSSSPKPLNLSEAKRLQQKTRFVESRQWWSCAVPSLISETLPLLRSGLLLQTCGHVVHRECFQRYCTHGANRSTAARNRSWVACPLCRRDIHHLLPLVAMPKSNGDGKQHPFPSVEYAEHNITTLLNLLNTLPNNGSTIWNDLNGPDDELNLQRRVLLSPLIGVNYEATVLLRSQLECELSVLMSFPSQYSMVSRRCYWREFISYLRLIYKLPSDIQSLILCLMADDVTKPDNVMIPMFALIQDPVDILLGLLPHIWPREVDTCQSSERLKRVLDFLHSTSKLPDENFLNQIPSTSSTSPCESITLSSKSLPIEYDENQIELHIILRLLPFLRIASLCWARWHPDHVGTLKPLGLPFVGQLAKLSNKSVDGVSVEMACITNEQRLVEFSDLCRILSLDCGDSVVINVGQVAELAGTLCGLCASDKGNAIQYLITRWIGQIKKASEISSSNSTKPLTSSSSQSPLSSPSSIPSALDIPSRNGKRINNISTVNYYMDIPLLDRLKSHFKTHIVDYLLVCFGSIISLKSLLLFFKQLKYALSWLVINYQAISSNKPI
ncbi:unnamed protein product [Trichobilharzia regenti]|nr:unnamed protein product [Trichobilharzia regenti]